MSVVRRWQTSVFPRLVLCLIPFIFPVGGLYSPGCQSNNSDSLCGWKNGHLGGCQWEIDKDRDRISISRGKGGSAFLTNDFVRSPDDPLQICVQFTNFVRDQIGSDGYKFDVTINTRPFSYQIDFAKEGSFCHDDVTETNVTVSLQVQCAFLNDNSYITDLHVTFEHGWSTLWVTSTKSVTTTGDDNPTEIGDIQYVGVVVGAICIALFTLFSCLTIISARRSNQRDIRRREVASASCQEEDDRPDVVAENAPPSYDAVMASPDMYPPTPQGTPHGTPETTPHLSIHRRALLNQHANSLPASPQSQRDSFAPSATEEWDEEREDPPPPYPGFANGDITRTTDDDGGEGTPGESTPGLNTQGDRPPEVRPSEVRPPGGGPRGMEHDEQDSNPWVLNTARVNTSADVNPRGGLVAVRGNTPEDGQEEMALRARTPEPESSDASTVNSRDTISVGVDVHESRKSADILPTSGFPRVAIV